MAQILFRKISLLTFLIFFLGFASGQNPFPFSPPKDDSVQEAERYEREKKAWYKQQEKKEPQTANPEPVHTKPEQDAGEDKAVENTKKFSAPSEKPMANPYSNLQYGESSSNTDNTPGVGLIFNETDSSFLEYVPEEVAPVAEDLPEPETPQMEEVNGESWLVKGITVIGPEGKDKSDIEKDLEGDALEESIWTFVGDNRLVINARGQGSVFSFEKKDGALHIKNIPCFDCGTRVFDILESSVGHFVLEFPYDDNEDFQLRLELIRP